MDSLTDTERAIIDMERQHWHRVGAKEQAIVDQFGMSPVRYYQRLATLINTHPALAYDPVTVKRLQRIRGARRHSTHQTIWSMRVNQ